MSSGDFSTPTKAKRNFKILKTEIKKKKKIRGLQNKVGRLESKITNLEEMLKSLEEKFLLTESSSLTLNVRIGYSI